ncbi:hypothetical protein ACIA8O_17940 [Kitasatospora sp. NPDC051853]|uniref:hypothetical protein n=1 Tax=Kitasatospora sp. NPDC051853 TaxID=3364058 RepID=UPI0037BE1E72
MLTEALAALAAAGGAAVVQAAVTDAWTGTRARVAGWFGRSDGTRVPGELELLDETARLLGEAVPEQLTEVTARQEALWRARFEAALAAVQDAAQRERAAEELRALLAGTPSGDGGVSSGDGSLSVGGDVEIRSMPGSIAAGVINGGAVINSPTRPERTQG